MCFYEYCGKESNIYAEGFMREVLAVLCFARVHQMEQIHYHQPLSQSVELVQTNCFNDTSKVLAENLHSSTFKVCSHSLSQESTVATKTLEVKDVLKTPSG